MSTYMAKPGFGGGIYASQSFYETEMVIEEQAGVILGQAVVILEPVNVAPPGHEIAITWDAVTGATAAEVDAASVHIGPVLVEESLGELGVTSDGFNLIVTVPQGKRIARLNLQKLAKRNDDGTWTDLDSSGQLAQDGPRLVVSVEDPKVGWIPLYAVPEVPSRGVLPPMFGGAGFADGVLTLPAEFPAARLRLSVTKNRYPEEFTAVEVSLEKVFGWASLPPRNLALVTPNDEPVWAFPGEMPATMAPVAVDLRAACITALNAALAASSALDLAFHLRGDAPGQAGFSFSGAHGALVRTFPGVLRTELAGNPATLPLVDQLAGAPLADEQPSSATADLTVRYEGIRLLETVADPLPDTAGGIGGAVVTDTAVVRALPPAALGALPLIRAGLIGRAPEACELSVQVVDMSTGVPGAVLGPPGVVALEPSTTVSTVWVDLPEIAGLSGPVGISARANRGRFFWVSDPDPLLRLAVRDPDPGGRPLQLGGQQVMAITEGEVHLPATSLPPAAFQSSPPTFESALFLTVDISDLVLRYQRST